MRRMLCLLCVVGCVIAQSLSAVNCYAATQAGDTAASSRDSLVFLNVWDRGGPIRLKGTDATAQLVVQTQSGSEYGADVTRTARYQAEPEGVVLVSPDGWLTSLRDGLAVVTATATDGAKAELAVEVSHQETDVPVNFASEVVPVFTKYGCNGGGCHGKASGQNGFRLSLLGFEPTEDYDYLVRESRGRRLFPAAPQHSLLLKKATGSVPHGGGERFDVDSPAYRVLKRWIAQGMPTGSASDPTVSHIEVLPKDRVLSQRESQQLCVLAHYTDGSMRDVTRVAQYESGDPELVVGSAKGLVTAGSLAGSSAVMVRFQTHVDVFRITVPLGAELGEMPEEKNLVDKFVFAKLRQLGLPPSGPCSDSTFIRRATLDIAGRLPTTQEAKAFVANTRPNKRERLVDDLLASSDYADYFAGKWSAILRNRRNGQNTKYATYAFHDWIRSGLLHNKPYDQFVREVVAASGQVEQNPAVAWYHQVRDQASQVEDVAQLFLGMRLQCARCHHHPAEKWSQADYFGLSAYFSRVGRKASKLGGGRDHIFHNVGRAQAQHPKTGQPIPPTPLDGTATELASSEDPRRQLADWMTSSDNPFFAKALVNRYWKHFFGRGLVEPEDDMRVTNPPTHPELLDGLSKKFVESGYDLKALVRTLCTSQTYSLSAIPNEHNTADKQSFSRFYPRRLPAEVLLDSIDTVTGTASKFSGMPAQTRAVSLPDNAFNSYFLKVFGRPDSESACECERSDAVNLAQCLHLLNSDEVRAKTGGTLVQQMATSPKPLRQQIHEIYWAAFSRPPTEEELLTATEHIAASTPGDESRNQACEDLLWVLINTKEFLFNH